MLLSIENSIHLFEGKAFGLDPEHNLLLSAHSPSWKASILTMRTRVMISHAPLIMYIFQPMLLRPMGMTKTKRHLDCC